MANVKISALPAATSVAAADTLPIVQSATTKKATFQNVIDAVGTLSPADSFKNVIINGDFRINQRGLNSSGQVGGTAVVSGGYGFDRWVTYFSGGTVTYSSQAFTLGNAISGQEPISFARIATSGQSAAGDRATLWQAIESVRTFAGQQVTVSFWAKAASGTPKVAVSFQQSFGTGGSPSTSVDTLISQVILSTSWVRYSVTGTVPSISGKTIGTNNNDALWLGFYTSAGSTYNGVTGSLGIQNATIDFWGVQVEAGANATTFERRPIGTELALCQRYYTRFSNWGAYSQFFNGMATSTSNMRAQVNFPNLMRTISTGLVIDSSNPSVFRIVDGVAATSPTSFSMGTANQGFQTTGLDVGCGAFLAQYRPYWLDAGNQTVGSAYIGFSAEL